MDHLSRNVRDIDPTDRLAIEHVLGQSLRDDQQVVISIHQAPPRAPTNDSDTAKTDRLPSWCNVFEGLSEKELAEVEEAVLRRADLTREIE